MSEILCDYCNNNFKSNSSLEKHKKTAKFCLIIQEELKHYLKY
jgi:hypothetical protein